MNDDEEYEEETEVEAVFIPCWRWSWWEIPGIASFAIAGVLGSLANGMSLLARECAAAANYQRQNADYAEALAQEKAAQKQAAEGMREILGLPTYKGQEDGS